MSRESMCKCKERNRPASERDWEIIDFKCAYPAFGGHRRVKSEYSGIKCNSCGCYWRSKASYVDELAHKKPEPDLIVHREGGRHSEREAELWPKIHEGFVPSGQAIKEALVADETKESNHD